MPIVRRGPVFETNSSSTHSISLSSADVIQSDTSWKSMLSDDGFCIEVAVGEFGWEVETYTDSPTKASYLVTDAVNRSIPWDKLNEYRIGEGDKAPLDFDKISQLPEVRRVLAVIEEHTGLPAKVVGGGPWHETGYIDHQSSDVPAEAMKSADTIRRFIFDRRSVLETDNDNR